MRLRLILLGLLVFAMPLCTGCGQKDPWNRQAVEGTVTLNGNPVMRGTISLVPQTNGNTISGGQIRDGKFSIPRDKGLAPGEYGITLSIPDPSWGNTPDPPDVTPPDWGGIGAHKITVTEEGPNVFQLDVTGDAPPSSADGT